MKSFSLLLVILLLAQTPAPRVQPTAGPVHRLDPLSAAEITLVTDALSKAGRMPASVRVVTIELSEPDKASRSESRVGRAVLYDWSSGVTTEMTVDLQSRAVGAATTIATGDPPVRRVVIDRATEIAVGDRRVVQALARHGVTDLNRITFLGGLGEGTRLPRRGASVPLIVSPLVWDPIGNDMEVRGVDVRVDLAAGTVEEVLESPAFAGGRTEPQVPPPPLDDLLRQIEERAALLRYAAETAATNEQPPDPKVLSGLAEVSAEIERLAASARSLAISPDDRG